MHPDAPSPDDALSPARLARALGVSESIVRRWTTYAVPLVAEPTNSGAARYTLRAASAFIAANDGLPSAPRVLRALAELGVIGSAAGARQPSDAAAAPDSADVRAGVVSRRGVGADDLAMIVADVRSSLDAAVRAVSRQSRLAEQTAQANREIVDELLTSIRGLDASLSMITGPTFPSSGGLR